MKLQGEFRVDASADEVYSFLTDMEKVTGIIPDVIQKEVTDSKTAKLVVKAGISAIKGKFNVTLTIKPINGNTVEVAAKGSGSAGNMDVLARYVLQPDGGATKISWEVDFNIAGTIATMGARVINGVAEKYVKTLTDNFVNQFRKANGS